MKYIVIQEIALYLINSKINELIREGWQVQGGVSTVAIHSDIIYTQAMVKK